MAKIVNMLDVPRLYSQKDDRFRYEAVKENVLGLKNICGEIVVQLQNLFDLVQPLVYTGQESIEDAVSHAQIALADRLVQLVGAGLKLIDVALIEVELHRVKHLEIGLQGLPRHLVVQPLTGKMMLLHPHSHDSGNLLILRGRRRRARLDPVDPVGDDRQEGRQRHESSRAEDAVRKSRWDHALWHKPEILWDGRGISFLLYVKPRRRVSRDAHDHKPRPARHASRAAAGK